MWNIYQYYYFEILRYEFLVKNNYNNIHKIKKIKFITLYINLFNKNLIKDLEVLKYILLLKIISGQLSFLKCIKFKFKLDNKNLNFLCKVTLRNIFLDDFLSYILLLPIKTKKKYLLKLVNNNIIYFNNFPLLFKNLYNNELFIWNNYLNFSLKFTDQFINNKLFKKLILFK